MASSYIVRHGAMRFLGKFEAEGDTACARGTDVDKPRNLAKSVTVE